MTAWLYIPGVPAAGHVLSTGGWHPGAIGGCGKCPPPPCPVLWAPTGDVLGTAATEHGALTCAARIPKLARQQLTANRQRRPGGSWAWLVGPQPFPATAAGTTRKGSQP
jgi:hypothetical protein